MNATPTNATFESAMNELEAVLRDLESDGTSLDAALGHYERGVALLRQCYGQLKSAELRIQQLTGVNEDGTPQLTPFEHTAAISKAKAARPG
jgi:exodeoxyribonuclease VII small subunit